MAGLNSPKSENSNNSNNYSTEKIVTVSDDFLQWFRECYGMDDQVIHKEHITLYNEKKKGLLVNTKLNCDSLNVDYNKWKFEKISLKKRSISTKVLNIWRNGDNLKHLYQSDIKSILYALLDEVLDDFNPKSIARDLSQMYRLFTNGAFSKLADKLVNFLIKKFPMGQAGVIATTFADKLVLKASKNKKFKLDKKKNETTKEKEKNVKQKILFDFSAFKKHMGGEIVPHSKFKNRFIIEGGHLISELDSRLEFDGKRQRTIEGLERGLIKGSTLQGKSIEKPSTMFPRLWNKTKLIKKLEVALKRKAKAKYFSNRSNGKLNGFNGLDTTVRLNDGRGKSFQVVVAYSISVNKKTKTTKIRIITTYPKQDR